ncbi:MAG: hypothetical protein IJ284_06225 [Clostridia bacterium]|nr:hypothetical protein [Clostridia bacterium]
MNISSTRKKVFICNMVIVALCLVSILAYFIMPFWKVSVKYELTAETLQEMIPSDTSSESSSEEETGSETDDVLEGLDVSSLTEGEEMPTLKLSIALKTTDIISSLSADSETLVKNILIGNVDSLIDQLDPLLSSMVKKMLKGVAKETFSNELKNRVKEKLGENASNEEVQAELDAMGLTDAYLDGKTDELIDHVYAEGTTVESAADKTVAIVEETIEKMKTNPDYQDTTFTEEDKAELKADLMEQYKQFEKDDGTIDPEAFTTDFLLNMLKGEEGSSESSSESANATYAKPLSVKAVSSESSEQASEEDTKEELKELLAEKLMSVLGGASDIIVMVIQYMSYVLFFTFFTWLYLIIKILAKLKRVNNAIKLKLPIWLGSLPFVVLCLLPTIGLKVAASFVPMLGALSISFMSAGLVSFIIGVGFIFFSIFYYGKLRKTLKRAAKEGYTLETTIDEVSETEEVIEVEDAFPNTVEVCDEE